MDEHEAQDIAYRAILKANEHIDLMTQQRMPGGLCYDPIRHALRHDISPAYHSQLGAALQTQGKIYFEGQRKILLGQIMVLEAKRADAEKKRQQL